MPLPTMTEKKRAITVIMQKMKGGAGTENGGTGYEKKGEEGGDKPRSDSSVAKSGAMQRFLSAVESKNPDDMASALETFYELCSGEDEETETPEEY